MNLEDATWDNTPPFTLEGTSCEARVLDVYDGDTLTLAIPFSGGGDSRKCYRFQVRIHGIDTPEMRGDDKPEGTKARDRVIDLLTDGEITSVTSRKDLRDALSKKPYLVFIECQAFDKYGRVLGKVYHPNRNGRLLSEILIEEGLGKPY